MVGYFLISEVVISYWATRQVARGEGVGRTGLLSSMGISGIGIPLFAAYMFVISQINGVPFEIVLLGAVLLPVHFVSQTLAGINLGHKPHATSYSLLLFDVLKIAVGAFTILLLQWDIHGAILAILAAFLGKIAFQVYMALPKLKNTVQFYVLSRWIRTSWLPLFHNLPGYIQLLDVVLYSVITGSILGVAYHHAAYAVAKMVRHSGMISQALYPKLLADKKFSEVEKNFDLMLFFAIPMTALSAIFSHAGLFVLNPLYQEAWPAVVLLAIRGFFYAVRAVPSAVVFGAESVDTDDNVSFSRLVRSSLFKLPLAMTVFNAAYIVLLVGLLALSDSTNEFDLVALWAALGLLTDALITGFIWTRARRITKLNMPWMKVLKFLLATMVFVAIFHLTSEYILDYDPNIYRFLPLVVAQVTICIVVYLSITYAVDSDTRSLFKAAYGRFRL